MQDIVVGRNQRDREKFGTKGTIFLGKHYIKMGREQTLSNKIFMDIAGAHVVFICGKRGGGKCLTGDSLVTLTNGKQIPIKDMNIGNQIVMSLGKDYKLKSTKKTNFYKRKVKNLLKLKLRSGKEIKLTPEHPLLTINGWTPAKSLKKGFRIATPRKINSFGKSKLQSSQIKIIAYLIAEGHLSKGYILFSNKDKKIINDFKKSIMDFDKDLELKSHGDYTLRIVNNKLKMNVSKAKRNSKGQYLKGVLFDKKNSLKKYLEKIKLYGNLSTTKFIPEIVFSLEKKELSLFLNRLFSCDGSIYKEGKNYYKISYSSSSRNLIYQVQHLLLRFGILSKIRLKYSKKYNSNSYEIEIKGNNVLKFIKEIGFFGDKAIKSKKALILLKKIKKNSNIDTIPQEIWEVYKPKSWTEIGKKLNYKIPKSLRESIRYSPTREKLFNIAKADNNREMQLLANSDIFWDEIVNIKKLSGSFDVYDITVANNHNFIANDIIVHNSYTMGVIAEGMADLPEEIRQNLSIIMLDTMGIYWTMKYPNKEDKELLSQWGLESKSLDVQIFTPTGHFKKFKDQGIPTDFPFSIKPSELSADNWCMTLGVKNNEETGVLISDVINNLKDKTDDYSMQDIIDSINTKEDYSKITRGNAKNLFLNTKAWGLFDEKGTKLSELVKPGQITVLDVSCYATVPNSWNIKNLVIGLVAEKLFIQRMIARKTEEFNEIDRQMNFFAAEDKVKKDMPLVWLVIDECLPYKTKIQTDRGVKEIGKIVSEFSKESKIKVVGYDKNTKKCDFYSITKTYKRPKKEVMKLITETGQSIICTPNHKVYSSSGFCEAQNSKDIAFPLLRPYKKDKKLIEARLLGSIFGDGWLLSNGKAVGFSGKGNNVDLEKIKQDLAKLGFKSSSIYTTETNSKVKSSKGKVTLIKGVSSSITTSTKAWKHFRKLGAPVGTKVLIKSKIPPWIFKGSKEVKGEFLAGLMGADRYVLIRNVNIPSDFNAIRLSFNKVDILEKNAFDFAIQLKKMLMSIGVKVSNITKRTGNTRKNGNKTFKIQITFAKSIENTIKYLENIGYRYCEKKELQGQKWLAYLRYRKNILDKRKKLRIKAIKLHKEKGLGKIRIGRILNIPDYVVREWIYHNKKSGAPKNLPSFREWTSKKVYANNLFLNIITKKKRSKEFVYDLSIEKVHNFVADDFLVHNCHEFLPVKGKTLATDPLVTVMREGRQPGISLILATQQPGKIHTDVMTQSDIVLSHRITAQMDTKALGMLMQSYMRKGLTEELDNLPRVKGAAIIFDDTNEKMYPMRVRPRFTWHGGSAPNAVHEEKEL